MLIALLLLVGCPVLAKDRVWMSNAGTQIEAAHVATINGQYWLRAQDGRILKLTAEQFGAQDRAWLEAGIDQDEAWLFQGKAMPVLDGANPQVCETIEILATTVVPQFAVNRETLTGALEKLSDALNRAAPAGRRLVFRVQPDLKTEPVTMTLRNLTGLRILEFLCGSGQRANLVGVAREAGVDIVQYEPGTVRPAPAKSTTGALPVAPLVVTSSGGGTGGTQICSAAASNLVKDQGFEEGSSVWVMLPSRESFKRIPTREIEAFRLRPELGAKTMMVMPAEDAGGGHLGPPYLTQEIRVPGKTRRLLICCDLAFLGKRQPSSLIRLSVTDPDVSYALNSGRTFPFKNVSIPESGQWKHVEWEVDVSGIDNRRMAVGFMFPISQVAWYIDNPKVTVLPDS